MKKTLKKTVLVIAVIACLLGAIFGFAYWKTADARELSTAFVGDITKNEFDKAYALLHANLKKKVSYEQFVAMMHTSHMDTIVKAEWSGYEIKNSIYTITGDVVLSDGKVEPAKITATRLENGDVLGILGFNFGE